MNEIKVHNGELACSFTDMIAMRDYLERYINQIPPLTSTEHLANVRYEIVEAGIEKRLQTIAELVEVDDDTKLAELIKFAGEK